MHIQKRIEETWRFCVDLYGLEQCISLCHHGSYNYECDLPESDADAKLIVAPSWEDIVFARHPMSRTVQGPYGDINVVDIRLYIGINLYKQNFNFLETLFTPYSVVNPLYADLWAELMDNRDIIAYYRPEEAVRTMVGQVENQRRRWNKFDNNKTLYHMMRISWAIESYCRGNCFADTLIPMNMDHIMRVRKGLVCECDMEYMFELFYEHALYCAKQPMKSIAHPEAKAIMDSLQARFVGRAIEFWTGEEVFF